jgi:hypothetical protein
MILPHPLHGFDERISIPIRVAIIVAPEDVMDFDIAYLLEGRVVF